MAGRAQGWRLCLNRDSGIYGVRWRKDGQRRHVSTGERDPERAAEAAARLYAEAVSGRRRVGPTRAARTPIDGIGSEWIADLETSLDPETTKKYDQYVDAWSAFFGTLDRVTAPAIEDFWRARLRVVKRRTVIKQLYALGGFLAWCVGRGLLAEAPAVKLPPKSSTGRAAPGRVVVETVPLSAAEVRRVLSKLPEASRKARSGRAGRAGPHRVRDRFTVAWETGLRPATLDALRCPEDYQRGAHTLKIRDEIDKARFGRELPLTPTARAALDRVAPEVGLIFGRMDSHTASKYLRAAATAAKLPADKAASIKAYDIRHGRGTDLAEQPDVNLVGVAFLLGHKAITTTNKYVHGHRVAAEKALGFGTGFGTGRMGGRGSKRGGGK